MARLLLYNKDIQILTGKNEKAARRLSIKILENAGKEKEDPLTVYDVSIYLKIGVEEIRKSIGN